MELVKLATIQKSLFRLIIHYPESGHNHETIKHMANDFYSDCRDHGVRESEFINAIKDVRQTGKYFPKTSDIIASVKSQRQAYYDNRVQQEKIKSCGDMPQMTHGQVSRNKKCFAIMDKFKANLISHKECARQVEKIVGIPITV